MKRQKIVMTFVLPALFCSIPGTASGVGPTYAIVESTIVAGNGPSIINGVLIVHDGLIESVGPQEKTAVPADAQVIEAEGMFAYPGLFDAHTDYLLEPPPPTLSSQAGRQERQQTGLTNIYTERLEKFKKRHKNW